MLNRVLLLILSSLLLSGCFAESMTLVLSSIGASQGRVLQSTISPAVSFGVKNVTGKFPIEHIIVREKQRIAKKATSFEEKIIDSTKRKINASKDKMTPIKNKVTKLNNNLVKVKTFAIDNFKHRPRFSYKVR